MTTEQENDNVSVTKKEPLTLQSLTNEIIKESAEDIIFICNSLSPFFLYSPDSKEIAPILHAYMELEIDEAALSWPFVDGAICKDPLTSIKSALLQGDERIEDLAWEYKRLFVGPGIKAAPQWGSVYTDREAVVFGESEIALSRWMHLNNIEKLKDDRTPSDNFGEMLALCGTLCEQRPDLVGEFLKQHFLTWAGHFLDYMESQTTDRFYKSVAQLTNTTLSGLAKCLKLQITYPKFYK